MIMLEPYKNAQVILVDSQQPHIVSLIYFHLGVVLPSLRYNKRIHKVFYSFNYFLSKQMNLACV